MVHQASLENPTHTTPVPRPRSAAKGMSNGIGELLHDVVALGELQVQLLSVDAKESVQKATTPIALAVVGAILGLGSVPILLISLAETFVLLFQWERAVAYLASGLIGLVVAGAMAFIAWRQSAAVIAVFDRSRVELAENIRWIKYALTQRQTPPR
jgi:hypothetical protein